MPTVSSSGFNTISPADVARQHVLRALQPIALATSEKMAEPGADIMQWPDSVLDQAELERLRPQGVTALNSYIYQSMIAAATARDMSDEVARVIRNAVINAPNDGVLNPQLSALGSAGADQVAQLVKQVALQRK